MDGASVAKRDPGSTGLNGSLAELVEQTLRDLYLRRAELQRAISELEKKDTAQKPKGKLKNSAMAAGKT